MRYRKARDGEPCTVCGCVFFKGDKVEIRRGGVQCPCHDETFEEYIVKEKAPWTPEEKDKILELASQRHIYLGYIMSERSKIEGVWGPAYIDWVFTENGLDPYHYELAAEMFMDECREQYEGYLEELEENKLREQGIEITLIKATLYTE